MLGGAALCCLASFLVKRKVKEKITQLCPILCNPMNDTVHGILQAEYWSG